LFREMSGLRRGQFTVERPERVSHKNIPIKFDVTVTFALRSLSDNTWGCNNII